jgi:hypothetical protein
MTVGRLAVPRPGATEPEDQAKRHEREDDGGCEPADEPGCGEPDDQERHADEERNRDGEGCEEPHEPRVRPGGVPLRATSGNNERAMLTPSGRRLLAAGALATFLVGLGVAVVVGLGGEGTTEESPATTSAPRPRPSRRPPPARFVQLAGAGAFDPEGDGRERDEEAALAVDRRQDTSWRTERYSRFFKTGVGLVLDAGRSVRIEQVVVDSPTPGIRAEIRVGSAREGPFGVASSARTLASRTRFPVARRSARYVVVWIVGLPPESAGEISEVRVRARG